MNEILSHTHVPVRSQVLFSTLSRHFISPLSPLPPEQFARLLEESGGSQGHAKLYLLPINLMETDDLNPDYSCLAGLGEWGKPSLAFYCSSTCNDVLNT